MRPPFFNDIEEYQMKKPWTFLKHVRYSGSDYQHRVLMHIPIGLLTGIPFIGRPLQRTFHLYEKNEDRHTKDQAWVDLAGELIGNIIIELTIIGLLTWLIIWLVGVVKC